MVSADGIIIVKSIKSIRKGTNGLVAISVETFGIAYCNLLPPWTRAHIKMKIVPGHLFWHCRIPSAKMKELDGAIIHEKPLLTSRYLASPYVPVTEVGTYIAKEGDTGEKQRNMVQPCLIHK